MKRLSFLILLFWIAAVLTLSAVEADNTAPVEDDPGMILPSVILETKDLSADNIDAGLPIEKELSLPERELILPQDASLQIGETAFNMILPDAVTDEQSGITVPFVAEAMLGAGIVNSTLSRISFYKPGNLPRFKFLFDHELIDGYVFKQAGTGYNKRNDNLFASIVFGIPLFEMESAVNFIDNENGLQENGSYFSVVNRYISTKNSFKYLLASNIPLTGIFNLYYTTLILTGTDNPGFPVTYPPSEFVISPQIKNSLYLNSIDIELNTKYEYRTIPGVLFYNLHRFYFNTNLKIQTPFWLNLSASAGYFRNNVIPMLFPFEIYIGGSPSSFFSFGLRGGYFVSGNNLQNLFTEFPFMDIPGSIKDNHGWFGDLSSQYNFLDNRCTVTAQFIYKTNALYFTQQSPPNINTGLLPLTSNENITTSDLQVGFKWNPSSSFSLAFKNDFSFIALPALKFKSSHEAAIDLTNKAGTLGTEASLLFLLDSNKPFQMPVMAINTYFNVTGNIKLVLELSDLLQPFSTLPRYIVEPYISEGIRGIFKIEINF